VALLQALRANDVGAGRTVAEWERDLLSSAPHSNGPVVHRSRVPADWVDYNGHVHESRYLQLFGDATDALLGRIGVDAAYLVEDGSYFTVETHLSHLRELAAGDAVEVTTQILDSDEKRLHLFHVLMRAGEPEPIATAEQMLLHVGAASGRAAAAADGILERVRRIRESQAALPRPERAGRSISISG